MQKRFQHALQRIGVSEIVRPVFYNIPQCLRFEIGDPQKDGEEYLASALDRAKALYDSLPNPPDLLRIDFIPEEDPLDIFLAMAKLPTPQETDCREDHRHTDVISLYWDLNQTSIDAQHILREIIRSDLGGMWQFSSSVFFMDSQTATLFYLYDDRGADLASADKQYLRRMYDLFDSWILDYDRAAMLDMFEKSSLTHHPLTESHKQAICQWQYEGEYAVYNLPPYEIMVQKHSGFANPERADNYLGWSENGELIAYTNFSEKPDGIHLGIGVRPDLCGKGYGQKITQSAAEIAQERYKNKPVCLEVRTWNRRAIRCYEKAGFRIVTAPYRIEGRGMFYKTTKAGTV